ncbi:MAG: HD-GYP domain-containing protein [Candidatus Woesearchaeota archaeon]
MYNIQTKKRYIGKLPEKEMRISDLFIALSEALDMGKIEVLDHSRRVAYFSLKIAKELNLNKAKVNEVVLAALINDIGIRRAKNKVEIQKTFNLEKRLAERHSKTGYKLTQNISILPNISNIILHNHHKFEGNNFNGTKGKDIPLASRIIFLADRLESLIKPGEYILFQVNEIISQIEAKSGQWFDPEVVGAFKNLAKRESFWLNIKTEEYNRVLENWGKETNMKIDLENLESIASVMANLIDRISPFTSRHSSGVATIAAMLTHELGFNELEQRAMRIAGLFHDLGKLIIPAEIIEKEEKLNDDEYMIIKQHPYYSYRLLTKIRGLGNIPEWAAFHHERLNGNGYPFHLGAENLNFGSRILAVSDVFQALTEDRPYRNAFSMGQALNIIDEMKDENELDEEVVFALKESI